MQWNGEGDGAILQFDADKDGDKLFAVGAGGNIGIELMTTFRTEGITGRAFWAAGSDLSVNGDDALWIWAHGNKHRDTIEAGEGEAYSPVSLANKIDQLDKASTGNVVVWSCWAGVFGGFVEQFAAVMISRGYNSLHFWGAKSVTSVLRRSDSDRWKYVEVVTSQDDQSKYRPATRGDMNGFGSGLMTPYLRTKEDIEPKGAWSGNRRPEGSPARPRPPGWPQPAAGGPASGDL